VLVNLDAVVGVRTAAAAEADELMSLGEKYRVRVTTRLGEELLADLHVNLPATRSRVKDALNQPQRFLPLFQAGEVLYLNVAHLLCVQDGKAPPEA
jgi:hypothetical protein